MLAEVVLMSSSQLAGLIALVLAGCAACTGCAAWEPTSPNYVAPPAQDPTPSYYAPPPPHYAPPPPADPTVPPAPDEPTRSIRVAIAAVQLLSNCPDPPEVDAEAERAAEHKTSASGYALYCSQSTVQLALQSDRGGVFRVEAVRVLDGAQKRVAGSSTLRKPTLWSEASTYLRWDERITAGKELQISYKLGELDLTQGQKLAAPNFDVYMGPFLLELDVSIDGQRRTIRSPAFGRQREDMVET